MTYLIDSAAVPKHRVSRLLAPSAAQLALRIGLGGVFWTSARTKVQGGLSVSDTTLYLFAEEYRLPFIPSDIAAYMATYAEHILPLMLLIGLGTRLAGLGLFAMTAVIQLFVYTDAFLSTHLGWLAMAGAIILYGPGRYSFDHVFFGKTER